MRFFGVWSSIVRKLDENKIDDKEILSNLHIIFQQGFIVKLETELNEFLDKLLLKKKPGNDIKLLEN